MSQTTEVIVQFDLDNAAFEDDLEGELFRIFHKAQCDIMRGLDTVEGQESLISGKRILAINGNTVGHIRFVVSD